MTIYAYLDDHERAYFKDHANLDEMPSSDLFIGLVEVFDTGPEERVMDRYTVIYPDGEARAMSKNAGTGQGVCLWIGDKYDRDYIGEIIEWDAVPDQVKHCIRADIQDFYSPSFKAEIERHQDG